MSRIRVCYLASGSGTTVGHSLEAISNGRLPGVRPALVISNKSDAGVLKVAEAGGMSAKDILVMPLSDFEDSHELRGEAIVEACVHRHVTVIAQYGWLPKTPSVVTQAYKNFILNQHPARLDPGFLHFGGEKGMHGLAAIAANLRFVELTERRDPYIEATAHHAVDGVDEGDLIRVEQIEINPGEKPEKLQKRLLPIEWELQRKVLWTLSRDGVLPKYTRPNRLVLPGEEGLFNEAKRWGIEYAKALA